VQAYLFEKEGISMARWPLFSLSAVLLASVLTASAGCTTPLTKREQGGLIGGGVGAGTGAIIGSTVGHAAVGAIIGGPVGLIGGALIGDQLMAQDRRHDEQQRQLDENQAELERLQQENERLRQQDLSK
jgi:outer membrane lipoprotein SlyB